MAFVLAGALAAMDNYSVTWVLIDRIHVLQQPSVEEATAAAVYSRSQV